MTGVEIIASSAGIIFILVLIHLNGRITRLSENVHKRIDLIEEKWRSTETCNAIHSSINEDLKEIKEDIREIFKLLREK